MSRTLPRRSPRRFAFEEHARAFAMFAALGLLAVAAPTRAQVTVEAESFYLSYDRGGTILNRVECSGASGGVAVDGIDMEGEWIQFDVALPNGGTYSDSLRSAGLVGVVRRFQILIFVDDPEEALVVDTLVTKPGGGVG